MTTRVVVAEQHRLVRESLVRLLDAQSDVEVLADADRGDRALELAVALRPDVLVVDPGLAGLDGLQLCAELRRREAPTRVLFLTTQTDPAGIHRALAAGVTGYVHEGDSADELLAALHATAAGERVLSPSARAAAERPPAVSEDPSSSLLELIETGSYRDLIAAVEQIAELASRSGTQVHADLIRKLRRRQRAAAAELEPFESLTRREREVLADLVVGKSAETIAAEHVVSMSTVRTHIRGVLQKLDVNSQMEAVALAWRSGWAGGMIQSRTPEASPAV